MHTPLPAEHLTDTPRRVIRALFEWRWSAIGFFLCFFTFLMVIAYAWPPSYTANATVLVKAGRHNAPEGTATTSEFMRLQSSPEDVISEINVMLSRPVLDAVATDLEAWRPGGETKKGFGAVMEGFQDWCRGVGLLPVVDPHERLITKLSKKLTIEVVPATHVIEISYENTNKAVAARTIQFMLDAYLDYHTKVHADGRWNPETGQFDVTAGDFFGRQADDFRSQLDDLQVKITEFRLEHHGGDLTKQRDQLATELLSSKQALRALEFIESGTADLSSVSVLESPEISFHHQRLLDLKLDLAKETPKYTDPNAPALQSLRAQIETSRSELVAQLVRKRDFLDQRVQGLQIELEKVETDRAELERMISKRSQLQTSYTKYSAKAEEERINQALDLQQVTSVKVLEWPALPAKPSFPNRFMMAILGFLLGIPGSIVVALLRAYFHSRVATVSDVETVLGVPVFTSIQRFTRWGGRQAFSEGLPREVLDAARMTLASIDTSVTRALHVASATTGEGAGTLGAALALAAAEDGKRVVFATSSGFPAVLSGSSGIEILQLNDLAVDGKRKAVAEARANADFVILAGPSLASGGGGGLWASLGDASLFVVSGSGVHFEVARRGLNILERYSPDVVGAVLTQRRNPIPRWLYKRA